MYLQLSYARLFTILEDCKQSWKIANNRVWTFIRLQYRGFTHVQELPEMICSVSCIFVRGLIHFFVRVAMTNMILETWKGVQQIRKQAITATVRRMKIINIFNGSVLDQQKDVSFILDELSLDKNPRNCLKLQFHQTLKSLFFTA